MNDRFDLQIITQHHSEVYCGYFRRLVFGNSLTFSHIPLCFHAKPPNFPRLFDPREYSEITSDKSLTMGRSVMLHVCNGAKLKLNSCP